MYPVLHHLPLLLLLLLFLPSAPPQTIYHQNKPLQTLTNSTPQLLLIKCLKSVPLPSPVIKSGHILLPNDGPSIHPNHYHATYYTTEGGRFYAEEIGGYVIPPKDATKQKPLSLTMR